LPAEKRGIGQDRGRANLQCGFKNFKEIRISEWFASGKVEFLDPKPNGVLQMREELLQSHHSERVILWRARDEAMVAPEVTKSACDLEPESIQMVELLGWIIESHGHKRASGG
jgi:hypothetical protein